MLREWAWELFADELTDLTIGLVIVGMLALRAAKWIGARRA